MSIPVIASFLGVETAVVIMAAPTVITNVWMLWEHRTAASQTRELPVLLTTGTIGVLAGTIILRVADPRWLAVALAAIIFGYLGLRLAHPGLALPPWLTRRLSPGVGLAAGLAQGATGISGPVVSTYLHAFGLPPRAFLFSTNSMFQVFAMVQIVAFSATGLYRGRVVHTLLAMVPIAIVFPIGLRMARRWDATKFDRWVLALLFVSGLKQVSDALGIT